MDEKVQISIDRDIYRLLQELQAPPHDINDVLHRLLFNAGKVSRALRETKEDLKYHRSFADEIKATEDGIYVGSGICT